MDFVEPSRKRSVDDAALAERSGARPHSAARALVAALRKHSDGVEASDAELLAAAVMLLVSLPYGLLSQPSALSALLADHGWCELARRSVVEWEHIASRPSGEFPDSFVSHELDLRGRVARWAEVYVTRRAGPTDDLSSPDRLALKDIQLFLQRDGHDLAEAAEALRIVLDVLDDYLRKALHDCMSEASYSVVAALFSNTIQQQCIRSASVFLHGRCMSNAVQLPQDVDVDDFNPRVVLGALRANVDDVLLHELTASSGSAAAANALRAVRPGFQVLQFAQVAAGKAGDENRIVLRMSPVPINVTSAYFMWMDPMVAVRYATLHEDFKHSIATFAATVPSLHDLHARGEIDVAFVLDGALIAVTASVHVGVGGGSSSSSSSSSAASAVGAGAAGAGAGAVGSAALESARDSVVVPMARFPLSSVSFPSQAVLARGSNDAGAAGGARPVDLNTLCHVALRPVNSALSALVPMAMARYSDVGAPQAFPSSLGGAGSASAGASGNGAGGVGGAAGSGGAPVAAAGAGGGAGGSSLKSEGGVARGSANKRPIERAAQHLGSVVRSIIGSSFSRERLMMLATALLMLIPNGRRTLDTEPIGKEFDYHATRSLKEIHQSLLDGQHFRTRPGNAQIRWRTVAMHLRAKSKGGVMSTPSGNSRSELLAWIVRNLFHAQVVSLHEMVAERVVRGGSISEAVRHAAAVLEHHFAGCSLHEDDVASRFVHIVSMFEHALSISGDLHTAEPSPPHYQHTMLTPSDPHDLVHKADEVPQME